MKFRELQEFEKGIEEKYIYAADLIEDVWIHIDWDNIGAGRRMKIYTEMEGQIKGLSRCFSNLEKFLTKLCTRFNSYLYKYETREILKNENESLQQDILEVFRHEAQIPLLLVRLRRENKKNNNKKNENI